MESSGTLKLVIVTTEGEIFRGDGITEVTLPSHDGYMGILPDHSPFIVKLSTGMVSWKSKSNFEYSAISGGYAEILPDKVIILADVGEIAQDIDFDRAEDAKSRAESRLDGSATGDWSVERARAALARSLNRLSVVAKLK